eukprot:TRINITY_DN37889_c0_g1_i1.p1 TRINITY_DN37889_c0_g1~~TRINITY_DN37889_c0_g1_i1.p1  ORF type:complete len:178 (+),score=18.96 TRINITY_DN37889_c0_g1_i1:141-674(+)
MAVVEATYATARIPVLPGLPGNCRAGSVSSQPSRSSVSTRTILKVPRLNVQCVRVAGVEIPNNKRVEFSLQYIHGIGRTTARKILINLGMENKHTKDLSQDELIKLRKEVTQYEIEGDLRRFNDQNIKALIDIRSYRGRRHLLGLPCRGQRTRNNCRTLKGKRASVIKKKKRPPEDA